MAGGWSIRDTPLAKQQLNTEYENIKARLVQLLKEIETDKSE